jgi:hypothetical protein
MLFGSISIEQSILAAMLWLTWLIRMPSKPKMFWFSCLLVAYDNIVELNLISENVFRNLSKNFWVEIVVLALITGGGMMRKVLLGFVQVIQVFETSFRMQVSYLTCTKPSKHAIK